MEIFELISGREHGTIWLENELRKQLKKNELDNKYSYVLEWKSEEKYCYGSMHLIVKIWNLKTDNELYDLCEYIPEYKINNIDNIFNCNVFVKAIIEKIKDYDKGSKK